MEWISVEDRLPFEGRVKPDGLCWDVYDPESGVRVSQMHPLNWNREFKNFDGSIDVEIVTHWMNRPDPPKETT